MNCNEKFSIDIKVSYICQNEYNYFLNKKGVVGVALGYKITHGFSTFKKCITVFVKKKLSINKISKENIIPICYKGIETDVVESDGFKFNSLKVRIRPVINGYSIGNLSSRFVGSCGCLVYDKYLYILSNNHILVLDNTPKVESVILQPGPGDGGTIKKDVIGHVSKFIPIKFKDTTHTPKNLVDCALCKVINRSFVSPSIAFIGTPRDVGKAYLNQDVQKVGRTTDLTYGKITNLYGSMLIDNPKGEEALFVDQIITTPMSADGDSGSLLLDKNIYAIGLLMGGSSERSIYNSLDDVLKALNVKLVTK